jgi:large subunit ribosomal protein L4
MAAVFPIYNQEGTKVGEIEQPIIFQQEVQPGLIHRYFVWVRSMVRQQFAHTKTRGEVSGGGKKPWKQKGTGRARVGSSRTPLWRKGGIVFGPRKNQTWITRLPRAERRKALFSAFSAKAADQAVIILEDLTIDTPQTKSVLAVLNVLPVAGKKVLHIHDSYQPKLFNAFRNLPNVSSKTISYVNLTDLLNSDAILMTRPTLESLAKHFS